MSAEHREMSMTVEQLRAHVRSKIESLSKLAQRFNLDEEDIEDLKENLEIELSKLDEYPDSETLEQLIDYHYRRSASFNNSLLNNYSNKH